MARTVKVMKEKAVKERAWEVRDKKIKKLEKLREGNKMRAQHINERKRKQLKAIRDEKLEKQRKVQRGMQALKEIQKYQKGADLPHQKGALPNMSKRDSAEKEGRLKTAKFSSLGFTGSR